MSNNKPDTCSGVLVVNKHEGVTSHRIISAIRKLFDTRKVGHTGTLDPMATGVLPILIGRAAKASDYLMAEDKRYTAEMKLGLTTDTEDITGEVLTTSSAIPTEEEVKAACRRFVGTISQVPPMYSAIKVDGRKLVDIAREGGEVERKAREVNIYSLDCEKISPDTYRLDVACSKGTYIRTLCKDIGEALGCGAVMSALVRTQTGVFTLEESITIAELEEMTFEERLALPKPVESLFMDFPVININEFYAKLIRGGTELYQKKLKTDYPVGQLIRLRCKGEFIALGRVSEYEAGTAVKPEKLFVL
ncbi:MAG: tRNA pseudouridine(55) synthase TruB [Ruminococcaceae bacterium]|nr:tRNA pseudouridine(55) synthase TruB [Oscillospiraceae bacterium]